MDQFNTGSEAGPVGSAANFTESDSRKCPIAHEKQSWTAYQRDLDFWKIQCTLESKIIAGHIVNRGFAKNSTFMSFKHLLELDKLASDDGYKYLTDTMTSLTKEGDPLLKTLRYQEWLHMRRTRGESISAYITRWTVTYNRAKGEAPFPISEQQAAYGLYLSFGFNEEEARSMSVLLTLDDKLTVKAVTDAVTRCQIVPKAAAQASASGNSRSHPTFAATAEDDWISDANAYFGEYEWDPDHGYLTFDSYQYDAQTETVLPVYWSEYGEDLVAYTDFGFLAADQCGLCGERGHWMRDCPRRHGKHGSKGKTPFGKQKGKSGGKGFSGKFSGNRPGKGQFYAGGEGEFGDFGESDWDVYFGKSKGGKKGGKPKKGKGFGKPYRSFGAPRSNLKLFGSHYSAPSENEGNPSDSQARESQGDEAVLESWANFVGPEFGFMTVLDDSAPTSQVTGLAEAPETEADHDMDGPAAEEPSGAKPDAPTEGEPDPYVADELAYEADPYSVLDDAPTTKETVGEESPAANPQELELEDLENIGSETRKANEKYRLAPLAAQDITLLDTNHFQDFLKTSAGQEMHHRANIDETLESRLVLFACDLLARCSGTFRADVEGFVDLERFLSEFRCFTLDLIYVASQEFGENFTRALDIRKIGERWKIRKLLSTPATTYAPPEIIPAPGKALPKQDEPTTPEAPPKQDEPTPPDTPQANPERPDGVREIGVLSAGWRNLDPEAILKDIKELDYPLELLLIRDVRIRPPDAPEEFHHRGFAAEIHKEQVKAILAGLNELSGGAKRWRPGVGDCCILFIDTESWSVATDEFGNERAPFFQIHCAAGLSAGISGFDLVEVPNPAKSKPMQFRFAYGLAAPAGTTKFATDFAFDQSIPIWFGDPIPTGDGSVCDILFTGPDAGVATVNPFWEIRIVSQKGSVTVLEVTKPKIDKPPKRKAAASRNAKQFCTGNWKGNVASLPPAPASIHTPGKGLWALRDLPPLSQWKRAENWKIWQRYKDDWYKWNENEQQYKFWGKDSDWQAIRESNSDGEWEDQSRIDEEWEEHDNGPPETGWEEEKDDKTGDATAHSLMTKEESATAAPSSALLSVPLQPGEVIYDPGCTADMGSAEGWENIEVAMQQRWGIGFTKGVSSARFRSADGGLSQGQASYTAQFQIPNVGIFKLSGSAVDCGKEPSGQTPVLFANRACRDLELVPRHKTGWVYSERLKVGVFMRLTSTEHWALPILDLLEKAGAVPIPPESSANFTDTHSKNG